MALLILDLTTVAAWVVYAVTMAGVIRMTMILWSVFVVSAFCWHTIDRHLERRQRGLEDNRELREKTSWSITRLVGHIFMTLYVGEAFVTSDLEWSTWCPGVEAPPQLLLINDVAFGLWVFTLVSFVYFQQRGKDFYSMTAHHVVTVYLLWISRHVNTVPYGLAILLLHDASDITVSLMQIHHDLGNDSQSILWFAVTTVLVWPATRIMCLGYLIWSISFWIPDKCDMPPPHIPRICLVVLMLMQLRWYRALLRIGYKMAVEGKTPSEAERQVTAGGR